MEKLKAFIKKYYEGFAYLFFGGLATLLNLVLFAVFQAVLGTGFATGIGNVLDNIICILFAYWTNRTFVFRSKTQGKAMAREFGAFVTCRLGTMLLDTAIMLVLGNLLAAQGAALMEGLLTGVFTHLNPETLMGITSTMVHTTDSSAAIAVIGGADGPTAIFVTGDLQSLWGMVVKVFSNVLVIVLNYVFSKLIIFKKK